MIKAVMIIGLGGFIGSVCRYLVQQWVGEHFASDFPWGTFTANIVGCFLIGLVLGYTVLHTEVPQEVVWFFVTGFCGAFTTFSTFSYEGLFLQNNGKMLLSLLYLGGSVITGLVFTWLGLAVSKMVG